MLSYAHRYKLNQFISHKRIESYTLTLVSGDKVVIEINSHGIQTLQIIPAFRNGYIPTFEKDISNGNIFAFPEDYLIFIHSKLDRELFNITNLLKFGYHDENMKFIPLIISLTNNIPLEEIQAFNESLGSAVKIRHFLSSINSVAVHVDKYQVQSFLDKLFTRNRNIVKGTELLMNQIKQIYLDGRISI